MFQKSLKKEKYTILSVIPALAGQLFKRESRKSLGKSEFWALEDVTFQAKRGEALGIIGHNGAGKSTLLKILCGIMNPTKGEIKVNGRLSALIEVGAGFHQDLTGRENVFLNGTILGMSRQEIRTKFDEILDFSGLEDFIDTPVKRYSSGMYARLGFSVAAHIHPDILLVDEVLSVGDWAFQMKCADKMKQLIESGVSVVFISHNLGAVLSLCNQCILLNHGKVVMSGIPEKVVKSYLDSATQASHHSLTNKIFVSKVTVLKNGAEESRLVSGDKVIVKVKVGCQSACDDMAMHIFFRNSSDYQVFCVYVELLEFSGFSLKEEESIEFNVELSMHLASGLYNLGIMIVDRNDVSHIYENHFPAATLYVEADDAIRCVANLHPKLVSKQLSIG
jgi:lipopolysaccharide transport system ATP-binding protein